MSPVLIPENILAAARRVGRMFFVADYVGIDRAEQVSYAAAVHDALGAEAQIEQLANWLASELRHREAATKRELAKIGAIL